MRPIASFVLAAGLLCWSQAAFAQVEIPASPPVFEEPVLHNFHTAEANPAFGNTGKLELADLDGDGDLDVVAVVPGDDQLAVFLGDGTGDLAAPMFLVAPSSGVITIADVNGDNVPDLLTHDGQTIWLFLGNGDGSFQPHTTTPPVLNPSIIVAEDFDGDGHVDLVVSSGRWAAISFLAGDGTGSFGSALWYRLGISGWIAAGDLDGDGILDIAGGPSVVRGNGDGTFQAREDHGFFGNFVSGTTITDLNSDGALDLVAVHHWGGILGVILGNGDGTFQTSATYAGGGGFTSAAGDLNLDGVPDVVTADTWLGTLSVHVGTGDGTLEPRFTLASGAWGFYTLGDVGIGDLNGDGRDDLVTIAAGNPEERTTRHVGVRLNATTRSIDIKPGSDPNSINVNSEGVIPVAILSTASFDASRVLVSSVMFGPDGAAPVHRGHIEDVNGDAVLDLVLHFKTTDTGIACGDSSAALTGQTIGGQAVRGADSVRPVPCE